MLVRTGSSQNINMDSSWFLGRAVQLYSSRYVVAAVPYCTLKPGMVVTPAAAAIFLEAILSPMSLMALDGGPTNATPASSHISAKEAFSLRKPYLFIVRTDRRGTAARWHGGTEVVGD